MEVTLSELCILTMPQKRAPQQRPFSGNVGHLEETKVKSLLDRVSPLGSCDFQTQMWLMAHRQSCFSYKPRPQAEFECDTCPADSTVRRRWLEVGSMLNSHKWRLIPCPVGICSVLLGPPEAFPREPQASPHIQTLLSKKRS